MAFVLVSTLSVSFLRLPGAKQVCAIYTSDVCVGHNPGPTHPEKPARLRQLLHALRTEWVPEIGSAWLDVRDPPGADVTDEQLLRVHKRSHLNKVNKAFVSSKLLLGGRVNIDADTIVSGRSEAAAKRAAGLVVAAVDDLLAKRSPADTAGPRASRAFVMVRPPGHHAETDSPQGFCCYNNVMVGVAHAQAVHGVGRVAILDFDVHHGNGDAAIAWSDPTRLYASSHESPSFPGSGAARGREGPHRNILNEPLPANSGSIAFRGAWNNRLLPAIRAFKPEVIFLSSGFDAHRDDPLSSTKLTDRDYEWLTAEVAALGKPIISVLEGGYNVEALQKSVRAHIGTLIGS